MFALRNPLPRLEVAPQVGPIGLDVSLQQLNLVQLQRRGGQEIRVRARASIGIPDGREALMASPQGLRPLVRQALKSASFHGRGVVSALPPEQLRILSLVYHPGSDGDEQAILTQLAKRLDSDLSEYVLDYLPVRNGKRDEERLALVAMARRDDTIRYLELLRGAGLRPLALEIGPAAIKRLIGALSSPDDPETVLAINFGRSLSYLTIVSGRRLLFDQSVEFGEQPLLQQVSAALDLSADLTRDLVFRCGLDPATASRRERSTVSDDEVSETLAEIVKPVFMKLVDGINRTLIYAASETRGRPVSQIYMLGSISRWPGADAMLGALLDIPVSTIPDPLRPFRGDGDGGPSGSSGGVPEIAVATGLALRGMDSDE